MDETKRFNIEDINIEKNKEDKVASSEINSLDESIDELDEIISEDQNSDDFVDNEPGIEFDEEKSEVTEEDDSEENIDASIKKNNEEVNLELENIVKNNFQEQTIVEMEVPQGKTIGIACDHRGYKLKQKLTKYLEKKGYTVIDFGSDSSQSVDYPEFGFKLGEAISNYEVEKGIAICGSGIGISIACNKVKGVRCAKVNNVKETKYARKDNDANVIAIAGNMPLFRAKDIIDAYLNTSFTGLSRHQKRIDMLNNRG